LLHPPYQPSVLRTPAYPLFLALVYKLAGRHGLAVSLANALLDIVTCLMLFFVARRSLQQTWLAFFAAVIFLAPSSCYIGTRLSEPLTAFLIVGWVFTWFFWKESMGRWLVLGMIFGALLLCRPVFAILPLVVGVWGLSRWNRTEIRKTVAVAWLFVGCAFVWSPWILRNAVSFQRFIPLAEGSSGLALWIGTWSRHGEIWDLQRNEDGTFKRVIPARAFRSGEEEEILYDVFHKYTKIYGTTGGPEIAVPDKRFREIALQKIRDHPWRWFSLRLLGTVYMLRQKFFASNYRWGYFSTTADRLFSVLFALGTAVGSFFALRRPMWHPVLLIFFYTWAIHFPVGGEPRYLAPAYALAMLVSFLSLERLAASMRRAK
jgi:4-amino-4-deoxy-L-arabinose transferase-like glycosyltransferase